MLSQLALFQELKSRADAGDRTADYLRGVLVTSFGDIQRLLADVRVYFRHFTDHSIDHSLRIARNIAQLLEPAQYKRSIGRDGCITSVDIFLLIAGALIHDVGMVVAESELSSFENDQAFRDLVSRATGDDGGVASGDWVRRGISRLAVAEYVRRHHPQRSMQLVLEGKLPPLLTQGRLGVWLGKVAAGHGLEFEAVCDEGNYPTNVEVQVSGAMQEGCNPRFAALCLRLGDLLDIGVARACPMLRALSEPLAATSLEHWRQYENVEVRGLEPHSEITIAGTCPSQESERLLREWVSWLEREAADATAVQNQDWPRYRLHLGRVRYAVEPQKDSAGKPKYEFLSLRFNLDERMVFERLFGKSLYGRPELALRELIQNAIDAQRARAVVDLASGTPDWNAKVSDVTRHRTRLLRERIEATRAGSPVVIEILERSEAAGSHTWIAIRDHGVGMTREAIDKYLLKVGRSRWATDPAVSKLGLGSVTAGAFGIGFLSALMIADRLIVETRSCLPNEEGIKLSVYGWQGYAATEPLSSGPPGTTVYLRISKPFFSSPEELAATIAKLVPLADYSLRLVSGGSDLTVPQMDLRPTVGRRRVQCVAAIDDCGSTVRIAATDTGGGATALWSGANGVTQLLHLKPPRIRLCQDGITVPEMSLPKSTDPEIDELEARDCVVDLRGSSRVPLDLSRNLVEGGNDAFWRNTVPILWDAICAKAASDPVALRAIGAVANRTLHAKRAHDPLRFAMPGGGLVRGLGSLDAPEIVCIDPLWSRASEALRREAAVAWLTPDTQVKEFAADLPTEMPMLDTTGGEAQYAEVGDAEEDAMSVFRASDVVDQQWVQLTAKYAWVSSATCVPCRLSRFRRPAMRNVAELLAFQPAWNWFSIQSPFSGRYELVPFSTIDAAIAGARQRELSYADFCVFLLEALFRTEYEYWGNHGPLAERVSVAGSKLERRRQQRSRRSREHEMDEDQDRSDDVRPQIDESLAADAELYQGVAAEAGLDEAVAPWEVEAWNEERFGQPPRL